MGIVRREGEWRLDKQDDGIYGVTYEGEPEMKIITSSYERDGFIDERDDFTLPVHEVDSFSEAERLFKKTATRGPTSTGLGITPSSTGSVDLDVTDGEAELPDLPPAGWLIVGAIAGGFAIRQAGLNVASPVFLFGIGLLFIPLAVVGLTYRVYQTDGAGAAVDFLVSVDDAANGGRSNSSGSGSTEAGSEKTPPAPQDMKDAIYFDRANQTCEWCDERTDSPEVHHIEPRSEGGPNEYKNLIALCPTCHSMADKGGLSRSKLPAKVARQMEDWETGEAARQ